LNPLPFYDNIKNYKIIGFFERVSAAKTSDVRLKFQTGANFLNFFPVFAGNWKVLECILL